MSTLIVAALIGQSAGTVEHSIPFELTNRNNIAVRVLLNERDQATFMFHTAVDSVSMIQKATRRTRSVKFDKAAAVTSWGGQSQPVRYSASNRLRIGRMTWDDVGITEGRFSGHFTDGKFGPSLFGDRVLEINFDRSRLVVHNQMPTLPADFRRLRVEVENGMMFVNATIDVGDEKIEHRFLIHSGYSDAILFDDEFSAKHKLTDRLKVLGSRELKDSMGNVMKTSKVAVPGFRLAGTELTEVPGEVFSGAIGRQKISLIGTAVLKRFNIVLDVKSKAIHLQPVHTARKSARLLDGGTRR